MHANHDAIEFEEPRTSICDCCGATTTRLTRYVHRRGDAFCCYLAAFSTGPKHVFVDGVAIFGLWGDGSLQADRTAFFFRMWAVQDTPTVMLIDAADSPFNHQSLGLPLDRSEALAHPLKQELFDLTDHIVDCDRPIRDFLDANSLDSPP